MSNPNTNHPATQGQLTKNERAARLIRQKFVLDMLYAIHKDETAALAAEYEAGDKAEIKNGNGVKIGTVSMSNPNKKAVPDDDSVLLGYAVEHGHEVEDMLPADIQERVHLVEIPAMAISSTGCRERASQGRPVWYLVPDGVVQYIAKNDLYA